MAIHEMHLDDQLHRSLRLNTELSSDPNISIMVVYKKSSSGNMTNYIVIKSTATPKAFTDLEVPADGTKIPPEVG